MKKAVSLLLFALTVYRAAAQDGVLWDTLKYQRFNTSLIVGIYQSYRNFENDFEEFKQSDTLGLAKHSYNAESRLVTGVEVIYDKFSISLGLRTKPQQNSSNKGNTTTFNTNFNFGGNRWYLQNTLRYFKGFYDANTGSYDSTFKESGRYYQRPDMENFVLRSKFLYFTNHKKYAFRSGYAGNYRQLRSAGTWIFSGNINYYTLQCDSSFFPARSRIYYGDYAGMQGLRVFGLSINAGAAGTLVIMKGLFVSGMLILGPEQQWRTYSYSSGLSRLSYISLSGDFRVSIGLNLKRCYILFTSTNDFVSYNSSFVGITNKSISGSFSFGWRFHNYKVPKLYKKFQETRLYKMM